MSILHFDFNTKASKYLLDTETLFFNLSN